MDAPAPTARASGTQAESLAAGWLAKQRLKIIACNVRCRGGEIDIICLDGETLVFVEVRRRTHTRHGSAAESITPAKQLRILHAAKWWLIKEGRAHQNRPCRFDAVLFEGNPAAEPQWIRGAFGEGQWG
ncbi:MAG: YraN family protein [Azoarcus sp.]|nr:YraN family protein [Azoarcus sp.]